MTQEDHEAAAAAMVEATLTQENLGELHGRLSRCFARVEPLQQARKYVTGLMSDLRMLRLCRAPVALTTGVCPTGAQVVPAW